MIIFISLLKRKEGMSYEEFKGYYKSNHSQIRAAIPNQPKTKCIKTERKFLTPTTHPIQDETAGNDAVRYDVIIEKWYENMNDLQEDMNILGHDDVWPIYLEDENKLFDRRYSLCYIVEEIVDR